MKEYVIKYLIGGYGAFGRVIEDFGSAKTHDDFLNNFWKRYYGMLDCVKPKILGLYLRESGDTRPMWEAREIPLTKEQKYGY